MRAHISGTPFGAELHAGTLLGGQAYRFEWLDILRSLSVLGRPRDSPHHAGGCAVDVGLVLIAQLYLLFPWMRALLVAQDFLRLATGTLLTLGLGVRNWMWWLLPLYLAAALLIARLWDPLPRWFSKSGSNRAWVPERATLIGDRAIT